MIEGGLGFAEQHCQSGSNSDPRESWKEKKKVFFFEQGNLNVKNIRNRWLE